MCSVFRLDVAFYIKIVVTVGLGTVAGHLESDPEAVLIWVDAHADINTINRCILYAQEVGTCFIL